MAIYIYIYILDVTLDLNTGSYEPYKKPNDKLLCINTPSDHPAQTIKTLPTSINQRLSQNSSNEKIFDSLKGEY